MSSTIQIVDEHHVCGGNASGRIFTLPPQFPPHQCHLNLLLSAFLPSRMMPALSTSIPPQQAQVSQSHLIHQTSKMVASAVQMMALLPSFRQPMILLACLRSSFQRCRVIQELQDHSIQFDLHSVPLCSWQWPSTLVSLTVSALPTMTHTVWSWRAIQQTC
jgi:hypothetical protein